MTNCEVINALGTYEVESQVYAVLSLASRLAAYVKNRANTFKIAYGLFSINRDLATFLNDIHDIMAGKKNVPVDDEPVTPQRISAVADNLGHLTRTIDYFYEASRRARLTNNTITAGSLGSLKKKNEELIDILDWLEMVAEPKVHEAIFQRAEREKEAGELYDLSQVG